MNEKNVTHREVLVRFDSVKEEFILEPNSEIAIPTAVGEIDFPLASVATVFFPSNPIQWVNDQLQPIDPPGGVTVQRTNLSLSVTITASEAPEKLSFYIIVQTQAGQFFGTDPTIVTMPPGNG